MLLCENWPCFIGQVKLCCYVKTGPVVMGRLELYCVGVSVLLPSFDIGPCDKCFCGAGVWNFYFCHFSNISIS